MADQRLSAEPTAQQTVQQCLETAEHHRAAASGAFGASGGGGGGDEQTTLPSPTADEFPSDVGTDCGGDPEAFDGCGGKQKHSHCGLRARLAGDTSRERCRPPNPNAVEQEERSAMAAARMQAAAVGGGVDEEAVPAAAAAMASALSDFNGASRGGGTGDTDDVGFAAFNSGETPFEEGSADMWPNSLPSTPRWLVASLAAFNCETPRLRMVAPTCGQIRLNRRRVG